MILLDLLPSWEEALRGLCAWLCDVIYPVISAIYDLFMIVITADFLSTSTVEEIYQRVTMILSIIMVFYVTFEFVKYVVEPDGISDKDKGVGKIIYKMLAVIVLLAFVPKIFTLGYKLQGVILDNQLISKVILGKVNIDNKTFGNNFSADILGRFYYKEGSVGDDEVCLDDITCADIVTMNLGELRATGKIQTYNLKYGINETIGDSETTMIHFDAFLAVIVGSALVYILITYCIGAGVRYVQMIYLQIIAPIPIISYLSVKKDGMFEKWVKQCTTTYIDVFIRISILYFVVLIANILGEIITKEKGMFPGVEPGSFMETLAYVTIILGLLVFAKKLPKLLEELFPKMGAASGDFGFSGDKAKMVARGAGAATGLALGTALGAVHGARQGWRGDYSNRKKARNAALGFVRGAAGGTVRGLYNGGKKGNMFKNVGSGVKNQVAANKKFGARIENNYGIKEQLQDTVGGFFGKSRTEKLEAQKAPRERAKAANEQIVKSNDAMREHALKKVYEKADPTSANLRAMEGKVKALTEDPNTKSRYKVGKYKTDDEAYEAYVNAVKDARASVNAQNYMNKDGTLNRDAYEREMNRVAAKVKQEDYQKGYATEAEAEAAYKEELGRAQAELKAAKDAAVDNYINTANDDKIKRLKAERDSQIADYNKYASPEFAINTDNIYIYKEYDEKGNVSNTRYSATAIDDQKLELVAEKSISELSATEFDNYTKQVSQDAISRYSRELGSITAQQEAIKRQQDGTGIGEKK